MYSVNEHIYVVNKRKNFDVNLDDEVTAENNNYRSILQEIQKVFNDSFAKELSAVIYNAEAEDKIKTLIMQIINTHKLADESTQDIAKLCEKIYNDMAGFSFLTQYLQDPLVEEININGAKSIWVQFPDRKERLSQTFVDAKEVTNIVKKMSRFGGITVDGSMPIADSYIANGVRMTCVIDPCVDSNIGAIASIRKQKKESITRDKIISWGTVSEAEMQFLETCLNNGVSIAFAGNTGAGKTADMGILLNSIPDMNRVVTIEDTSELNLSRFDSQGKMLNDVVQMLTVENKIYMADLVKKCLRLHPMYIVPAEMRDGAALDVVEAGRTGHIICSTLHAKSAKSAYERILSMCLMTDTTLSEGRILKNIVEAFPLMVFKEQLPDGSRKYMEIFEPLGVDSNGEIYGNYIYKFRVTGHQYDEATGCITKILGEHQKVGGISDQLAEKLFKGGVAKSVINGFKEVQNNEL